MAEKKTCTNERWCQRHGTYHGQEAERLRAGIERILVTMDMDREIESALHGLLEGTDAADSLSYAELDGEYDCLRCKARWLMSTDSSRKSRKVWRLLSPSCGDCCDNVEQSTDLTKVRDGR